MEEEAPEQQSEARLITRLVCGYRLRRFSNCPLHGAVHLVRMKKPSLENGLVLVRYRDLARAFTVQGAA